MVNEKKEFAFIIDASMNKGLVAQLKDYSLTEDVATNSLVIVEGKKRKYLALIYEIFHAAGSEQASSVSLYLAEESKRRIAETTAQSYSTSGRFITALKAIPLAQAGSEEVEEVDTIPVHVAKVLTPSSSDIEIFYGKIDRKDNWGIGYSKSPSKNEKTNFLIPMNIEVLTRGSFGIFGKSGTGKTHLGNIVSALILLHNRVNKTGKKTKLLIFDMHSEYGLKVKDQQGNDYAEGVGMVFRNEFKIYTPDSLLARETGIEELKISAKDIEVEDLFALQKILDLSDAFLDYLRIYKNVLERSLRQRQSWVSYLLGFTENLQREEIASIEQNLEGALKKSGTGAISAFRSGRAKLSTLRYYEFITNEGKSTLDEIVEEIFKGDRSVIISLGRYGDDPKAYMLIAQLLSRRVWSRAIGEIMAGRQLKYKLVIFLEEAHKFLSPSLFDKTAFGAIARELRKRGIILCIIDQRPSELAQDVTAMLWSNFVLTLTDEKDIEVATRGLKFASLFKPVVSTLKRKEALIFGEAIRLPAVVNIVDYKEFIKEIKDYYLNISEKIDIPGY